MRGWRWNHCVAESWNRNAARLQFHLSGNAELHDKEKGFNGIEVCKKVPDAISRISQEEMQEKASEKDSQMKRSASAAEMGEAESFDRANKMKQQSLPGTGSKAVLSIKADNSVSDFFDGTATPHSVVDSYFFRTMIENSSSRARIKIEYT